MQAHRGITVHCSPFPYSGIWLQCFAIKLMPQVQFSTAFISYLHGLKLLRNQHCCMSKSKGCISVKGKALLPHNLCLLDAAAVWWLRSHPKKACCIACLQSWLCLIIVLSQSRFLYTVQCLGNSSLQVTAILTAARCNLNRARRENFCYAVKRSIDNLHEKPKSSEGE